MKLYSALALLTISQLTISKLNVFNELNISDGPYQVTEEVTNSFITQDNPKYLTINEFQKLISENDYHSAKNYLLKKGWKLEFEENPKEIGDYWISSEFSILKDGSFTYIQLSINNDPKYYNEINIDLLTDSKIVFDLLYKPISSNTKRNSISKFGNTKDFEEIYISNNFGYGFKFIEKTNIKKPVWSFKIKKDFIEDIDFNRNIQSFESIKVEEEVVF
ncbi:hypothetical protein [Sphingobacterium lactis]|uniref:hypothetical protein n=1 Tax=Sphingobacterium lactis TaxID=797291 RepID=UPI003DA27653